MKKLFLVFSLLSIVSLSLVSCSNDDDDTTDLIIGKWQLIQEFENDEEVTLDECELKNTIEFKTSGSFIVIEYEDDLNIGCEVYQITGTFENLGNSLYKMIFEDDIGSYSSTITLSIENDNLVMVDNDEDYTSKSILKSII